MSQQQLLDAINHAHAQDPKGQELVYVDSVSRWITQLVPDPSEALLLAARCQHFERWVISRDSYPAGRTAYLQWRRAVAIRQGERVLEIMQSQNCDPVLSQRVHDLVGKHVPLSDPEAQALEDAACLVFIEEQAADFAPKYLDKMIGIIQKTWKKMSPAARELALGLDLPDAVLALVKEALSE